MTVVSVSNGLTRQFLLSAQDALSIGNTRKGRRMARHALARSVDFKDRSLEAEAALVLGHAYVLDSRLRLAHSMSSRAQKLFLEDSNPAGQAEALAILSYSASALGLDDEALQAAKDGMALRAETGSALGQACGLNYLGVASFWSRDFGTARGVLEASIWFAGQANDTAAGFQPLVNLCCSEILRVGEWERNGRQAPDLSDLEHLVARARAMVDKGQATALSYQTSDIGFMLLDFSSFFVATRRGRALEADAFYLRCLERALRLPRTSWLQAVLWWARVERAVGLGDIETSIASLRAMGECARAGEHAQLHALASALEATLRPPLNQWDSDSVCC